MARLKAFTLLEISVALLLSGILVSLAYGIIGNMSRTAARWFGVDHSFETIRSGQQRLILDIDRAPMMRSSSDGFQLQGGAYRPVTYRMVDAALIRENVGPVDTVLTSIERLDRYWQGEAVVQEDQPMDAVHVILRSGEEAQLHFRKDYDAITLRTMQHEHADPSSGPVAF